MYKKCEEILKELESEGKLKVWWDFKFPEKEELKLRLKDMLEEKVDEKFYLTDSMIKTYQRDFGSKGKELDLNSPIPTLTASMGTGGENIPILKQYGQLFGGKWDKINESCRRVYSEEYS